MRRLELEDGPLDQGDLPVERPRAGQAFRAALCGIAVICEKTGNRSGDFFVPLGVDEFGQSGTIDDLYRHVGIDAQHVVDAALLALDIVAERPGSSDQPGPSTP